ncbi:YitT family protein [Mycoplasma buteonis]|uniref:YitT family protein n=1 Tax=Mycoplasma buteonis TaxID=171280 RepID=UPI00068D93BC|nr:YitT family protein [Mycoplasma buteonis]
MNENKNLDKTFKRKRLNYTDKHILEKYKTWHLNKYRKSDSNTVMDAVFNKNEVVEITKSSEEISQFEIKKETERLKYKMGKYLANNKKVKLTPSIFFNRYWKRFLLIFLAAVVFNFGIQVFLSRADTIPSGITGIPTILQYIFPSLKQYFALIYLGCNLPLFIIFWKKSKSSFMWLTLAFMICQIFINFLFTNINAVHEFISKKILLVPADIEDVRNYIYKPVRFDVKLANNTVEKIYKLTDYQTNIIHDWHTMYPELISLFDSERISVNQYLLNIRNILNTNNTFDYLSNSELQAYWYHVGKTWPILLYGSLGAMFIGMGIALSWKAGGSTGGTDIVAYYFSTKSKKSVANILSTIAIFTAIVFLIIYSFIKPNEHDEIFGMRELSTFAYILVSNLIVNVLYPKYKKMKLTIISQDPQKVIAYFNLINYWHSYRIVRYKSGYTGKYNYKIETVILLLESRNLVDDLKLIDPNIWISQSKVEKVNGKFSTQFVE